MDTLVVPSGCFASSRTFPSAGARTRPSSPGTFRWGVAEKQPDQKSDPQTDRPEQYQAHDPQQTGDHQQGNQEKQRRRQRSSWRKPWPPGWACSGHYISGAGRKPPYALISRATEPLLPGLVFRLQAKLKKGTARFPCRSGQPSCKVRPLLGGPQTGPPGPSVLLLPLGLNHLLHSVLGPQLSTSSKSLPRVFPARKENFCSANGTVFRHRRCVLWQVF